MNANAHRLIPCLYLDDRDGCCEIGDRTGYPLGCPGCLAYVAGKNSDEVRRIMQWATTLPADMVVAQGFGMHLDKPGDLQSNHASGGQYPGARQHSEATVK